ncbi:MAG: threonylcarbamoyl-AMP synthase [Candidatus Eisenbacteria bacterium]|nr:threonylcarbamoyl-AMP synthase [Candidatus Eisenbacteria bacterium]
MGQLMTVSGRFSCVQLAAVVSTLKRGGVVCMAADTVYGLHCLADSEASVSRVRVLKGSGERPFILLVAEPSGLDDVAAEVPRSGRRLVEAYWPGPLTLVLRASREAPRWVVGPGDTVAVRCPRDRNCAEVLRKLEAPVVSTSANSTGGAPCLTGADAAANFLDRVDMVVDSGPAASEVPSTVVDLTVRPHRVLRQGTLRVDPGMLLVEG